MKQFSEVITLLNQAVDDQAKERILEEFVRHCIASTQKTLDDVEEFVFSDEEIKKLWDDLGDVPVIEGAEELEEYVEECAEEGVTIDPTLLNTVPYIDEDFFIWKKGTAKGEVWDWFDNHYMYGVEGLAFGSW